MSLIFNYILISIFITIKYNGIISVIIDLININIEVKLIILLIEYIIPN